MELLQYCTKPSQWCWSRNIALALILYTDNLAFQGFFSIWLFPTFQHMADDEEADAAIQALDGELLDGRRMQVALSKDESSVSSRVHVYTIVTQNWGTWTNFCIRQRVG